MSILRQFSTKHLLIATLICVPLLLHTQAGYASKKKKNKAKSEAPAAPAGPDYKAIGAPMPPVRVVYPKKAVYTDDMLKNDANLFVMMFHPTCEHCEEMTMNLIKDIDLFQKSHILLMAAPVQGPYLEFFANNTRVGNYPKIKVGLDSANFLAYTYNYVALPQINIYNAERKLIKTFNGITTIDSLKPYIQ